MTSPKFPATDFDASASPTGKKMLALLELLSAHPEGLTSAEAARRSGITPNLVSRLLQTLMDSGYATRREDNKAFQLSNRLLDLARPSHSGKSLTVCAIGALNGLRDETDETVQLLIEANHKAIVLEQVLGNHPLQVCGKLGMQIPLYSCAPGKAILASWNRERRAEWFRAKGRAMKSFTPTTLSRRKDLEADLDLILARGYAVDRAEGIEGIHCVATPILDPYGQPLAAITVMAPISRLPEDDFVLMGERCLRAKSEIESRLRE